MYNKNTPRRQLIPYNFYIKSEKVRIIGKNNENLGILPLSEAVSLAKKDGFDLVQIATPDISGVPTCKVVDFGKYKYELSKKQKEAAKKQRESEIKLKEIVFRPCTDENDLRIKAAKAKAFLDDGDRVKVSIIFKGREITHQNVAKETLEKFMSYVPELKVISDPVFQGKTLSIIGVKAKTNDCYKRTVTTTAV